MKTFYLLVCIPVLGLTACSPSSLFRSSPPAPTPRAAPVATPTLPAIATPTTGPAPVVETCARGQSPMFVYGFAELKDRLGDRMGEALSCERPGPDGDALQQTTTGMARYRKSTNVPSFTTGNDHWALTSRGLVHWTGRALDPPDEAEVVDETTLASAPTMPTPPAARARTPIPYADAITLPSDPGPALMSDGPSWIQSPLLLLREYDRRNGTVLLPSILRAGVSVGSLGGKDGAWGLFVPSSHRIVLDASLANESPQAVAPVLGHEADHARDTFQYGPPRSEAACYTFEITAFSLEARIWSSLYGPSGKPDPSSPLEDELNLILQTSRTQANTLIDRIKGNYQSECE